MSASLKPSEVESFLNALCQGHDDLASRIRLLSHSVKSKDKQIHVHAHFLPFRDGQPTVGEFVDVLYLKLVPFCLHRKHVNQEQKSWNSLSPNKIQERAVQLQQKALDLFKRANRQTNRNGEFGELITFLLIESVLKAPQFIAKMSLKTNSQMPVHGSDGIHVGLDSVAGQLSLYWGESKCYANVDQAIEQAVKSVAENIEYKKMAHELFLVEQYANLADFPSGVQEAILSFIDPYNENYNQRIDVSVVFIAFDLDTFAALHGVDADQLQDEFSKRLRVALADYVEKLDSTLEKHRVRKHRIEIFFLPVPSIAEMRRMFQERIGWTS